MPRLRTARPFCGGRTPDTTRASGPRGRERDRLESVRGLERSAREGRAFCIIPRGESPAVTKITLSSLRTLSEEKTAVAAAGEEELSSTSLTRLRRCRRRGRGGEGTKEKKIEKISLIRMGLAEQRGFSGFQRLCTCHPVRFMPDIRIGDGRGPAERCRSGGRARSVLTRPTCFLPPSPLRIRVWVDHFSLELANARLTELEARAFPPPPQPPWPWPALPQLLTREGFKVSLRRLHSISVR